MLVKFLHVHEARCRQKETNEVSVFGGAAIIRVDGLPELDEESVIHLNRTQLLKAFTDILKHQLQADHTQIENVTLLKIRHLGDELCILKFTFLHVVLVYFVHFNLLLVIFLRHNNVGLVLYLIDINRVLKVAMGNSANLHVFDGIDHAQNQSFCGFLRAFVLINVWVRQVAYAIEDPKRWPVNLYDKAVIAE